MGLNQPPLPPQNTSEVSGDDLMLGNYLYLKTEKGNELVTVSGIRQTSCDIQLNDKSKMYIAYHQHILAPVPLTEDWLVNKFGFKQFTVNKDIGSRKIYQLGNFFVEIAAEGHCFGYFYINVMISTFDYVHQLQNMFYGIWHTKLQDVEK